MKVTIDAYELKRKHIAAHPESHYFDRETLKYWGETMATMNVLSNTTDIIDFHGNTRTCYVLEKYGRDFDGKRKRSYAHFDVETLEFIPI